MAKDEAVASGFWRKQLTTFAVLFAGYASYTYNRKSVSFALPNLMKNGLLDKSAAGISLISKTFSICFMIISNFSSRHHLEQPEYSICNQ